MEVDCDAALDGFLSDNAEVRRRASEALERWRVRDPGGLMAMLASRIAAANEIQGRTLAAVLLRKVLEKSEMHLLSTGGSTPCCWPALGERVLQALSSVVEDDEVRGPAADVVATAASIQLARGHHWPELAKLMVRWCSGGRGERAAVLRILEHFSDETRQGGDGSDNRDIATIVLLALAQEQSNSLAVLLEASLRDHVEEASRDSAARIYAHCVAHSEALVPLHESLRDTAAVLAEAAATPSASSSASIHKPGGCSDECDGGTFSEACLQAVALATRAEPAAWAPLALAASGVEASLPACLMTILRETRA